MSYFYAKLIANNLQSSILSSPTTATIPLWPKFGPKHARHFRVASCLGQLREPKSSAIKNLTYKILTHQHHLVDKSISEASDVEISDIQIQIGPQQLRFNLTWLRDTCHCHHCTHKFSRQRLFTVKDFQRNQFKPIDVSIQDDTREWPMKWPMQTSNHGDNLCIKWADGHESCYPLGWLRYVHDLYRLSEPPSLAERQPNATYTFPEDDLYSARPVHKLEPTYWSVQDLKKHLTPVDYHDLIDGFEFNADPKFINSNDVAKMSQRRFSALHSLLEQLVALGLAKIVNVPQSRNEVLKIVQSIAYERPTGYGTVFDVVVEPQEEINLAYSSLEFDLHSDLTYREMSPGVQLLHCISNSADGGYSYFCDAFKAASDLRKYSHALYQILKRFPATFVVHDPYRDVKFRRQKPVLTVDHRDVMKEVYYSPFMLPPMGFSEDVKLFYLALDKYTKIMQSKENKFIDKMEPGDLYIFHNRRVLHGRSAYSVANNRRFLQGCYMDWDEVECLREKLASHME